MATKISGGLKTVNGYRFSAVECGIRYKGRLDFCLIESKIPCSSAGSFTTNRVFAAPVKICRERINNKIHGILINATNANACTGDAGYDNAQKILTKAEELLAVPKESLLNCSTGVIGVQLPAEKMLASLPSLINGLSADNGAILPKAIMTTDTVPKESSYEFETSLGKFKIAATSKGSGMIAPNMATLLCFVITDCPVAKSDLDRLFHPAVEKSLNAITIDGDMSTNDTALILSPLKDTSITSAADLKSFDDALNAVLYDMALQLVKDGEGATKCVKINVINATTVADAKKAAKSIAESMLVKTAFFGNDPNWGRIACAAGYSGAQINTDKMNIRFNDALIMREGTPISENLETIKSIIKNREFEVTVDLAMGKESFFYLTSDLSFDYVKINAEYTT